MALAGKNGWLRHNGVGYPFREWSLKLSTSKVDVTSFLSGGFSEFIAGFASGSVSARGFLDPSLQLTPGQALVMSLGIGTASNGTAYSVSFSGVLIDLTVSTAVDKAGELSIEVATNGSFTTTFAAA